jgi:three-Cys-motif partner protein
VRCAFPQQSKFHLAIIDGFAGGGRYSCGTSGSPLIFIEELRAATESFNLGRAADGMAQLDIECFLILNDQDSATIDLLKTHVEPVLAAIRQEVPRLQLRVGYLSGTFENVYPEISSS